MPTVVIHQFWFWETFAFLLYLLCYTNFLGRVVSFATAGNLAVQIEVWNCAMSVLVTDTLPVTIVEPTSYDIYLPIVIRNG